MSFFRKKPVKNENDQKPFPQEPQIKFQPCIIILTHNFSIDKDTKKRIYTSLLSYKPYNNMRHIVQFNQKDEDEIILDDNSKEKVFMMQVKYNSGISPNTLGTSWFSTTIRNLVIEELNVPINRIVIMCSQIDPDKVDFISN